MIDLRTESTMKPVSYNMTEFCEKEERKTGITCRPGRKLAAEKRRIAKGILQEFYNTPQFLELPRRVQLALLMLCIPKKGVNDLCVS